MGRTRTHLWMALVAVVLPAVGYAVWAGGRTATSPTYSVEGVFLVGDVPAGGAHLAFHSTGDGADRPVGVTGPDGTFRMMTHAPADGAPAGEYIVTVYWPNHAIPFDECACIDFAVHDRLTGAYADPDTSPL